VFALTRILVPTSLGEPSKTAIKYGVAFARQFNAQLYLVHVLGVKELDAALETERVMETLGGDASTAPSAEPVPAPIHAAAPPTNLHVAPPTPRASEPAGAASAVMAVPEIARAEPAGDGRIEEARRLLARGEYDEALEILNATHAAQPGNDPLRRMIAEAEVSFVEKAYRHYLPPNKVPVLVRTMESLTAESLSPAEYFLLSRIDGTWDVKSIIQITPLREVDVLRTLKRMREKGFIELKEGA